MTLHPIEKKLLRQIASFYGCKVSYKTDGCCYWDGPKIYVSDNGPFQQVISQFCHELAHYINWKTNKYPLYHNPKTFTTQKKQFKTYKQYVRYSLTAEIFTDKIGKQICKEWFPNIKYQVTYKNNKESYWFLYGYYQ